MKKSALVLAILVPLAACNKDKTDSAAAAGSSSAASATATTAATAPNLLDKALSFVTGGPFEGEITMQLTDEGKPPNTMVYSVKGSKMRFDLPAHGGAEGPGYAIMDGDAKKMYTVTESKKMAFEMDMNGAGASPMAAAAGMNAAAATRPNVEKTGKTDTVAGYSCEVWKVTEANGDKTELCVAKGISFPSMGRGAPSWAGAIGEGFFPLRVVTNDSTGKEKSKMEVTKIEKKTEDDARFQVPAGYKTMNMSDMMKGLGGMHGMGMHGMPH